MEFERSVPTTNAELFVKKRTGEVQPVSFDKVTRRIVKLCNDPMFQPLTIEGTLVAQKVVAQIFPGVTTKELDELTGQLCFSMSTLNPEYGELAKRIAVSNHHKNTANTFKEVIHQLSRNVARDGSIVSLISDELQTIVETHGDAIEKEIDYSRDYLLSYFGMRTLLKSYLLHLPDGTILERPQHMWMRVALGLYGNDLDQAFRCYHELSTLCYTHATPTLFNSGTPKNQLASCFLLAMRDDSIQGIFQTLEQCALISKNAGGIGLHVHNIRATGSWIRGTNGTSNGLVPMLKVFNDTARYVDQGGGKRNGAFAIYLDPSHKDIFEFLHLKRNHGDENARARDLFYALWTPDIFMRRVQANGVWTLFDPDEAPGLADLYGEEYDRLYEKYERDNLGKQVKAQTLWMTILESMVETGTPYMLFKDACNAKSNQKNLGTIKSSNLCTEIIEYSSKDETAVCNLASISLPACIDPLVSWSSKRVEIYLRKGCVYCGLAIGQLNRLGCKDIKTVVYEKDSDTTAFKEQFKSQAQDDGKITFPQLVVDGQSIGGYDSLMKLTTRKYNFERLGQLTESLVRNLNQTIDRTFYPTPETERSNLRNRPIGLGVQGLADVFFAFRYTFDSTEARELNKQIFATIYYHAMKASVELAQQRTCDIKQYQQAIDESEKTALEAKLWPRGKARTEGYDPSTSNPSYLGTYASFEGSPLSEGTFQFDLWDDVGGHDSLDWEALRESVRAHGARNSLLLAPMPTASTAQILGNTECFEPVTSNVYVRRTRAGEFIVANNHLVQDLTDMGKWSPELKDEIIFHGGSVQSIEGIPKSIKDIYKTVWEISQKVVIDMAADRGRYICQSQSMNLFLKAPSKNQISSMLMYAWKKGLKTGMYYLRTQPASIAQQFTIDPKKFNKKAKDSAGPVAEEEECLVCSA